MLLIFKIFITCLSAWALLPSDTKLSLFATDAAAAAQYDHRYLT